MGLSNKKLEIAILGLSGAIVFSLGFLLKTPEKTVLAIQNIVYEMPRPKTSFLSSLFNLADREITRRYDNPFAKKTKREKKAVTGRQPLPERNAASAKKAETKTQITQRTAKKRSENSAKNKKFDVQVVGEDSNVALAGDEIQMPVTVTPRPRPVAAVKSANPNPDDNQRINLGGAQWRALILAQPSKQNISKLLETYNKSEIDDATFFMIVTDFFRDNKVERQIIGMAIVKSVYNQKSFSTVAAHYNELAPQAQDIAHTYLLSYAANSRLGILINALQSGMPETVSIAAQVVLTGYQKAKDGVNPAEDPRQSRGDGVLNSLANYTKFVPVFQKLSQSQDPAIANLANTALNQMQVSVASL